MDWPLYSTHHHFTVLLKKVAYIHCWYILILGELSLGELTQSPTNQPYRDIGRYLKEMYVLLRNNFFDFSFRSNCETWLRTEDLG